MLTQLDHQLRDPFGGPHHGGRIDGFVGRDEHEMVHPGARAGLDDVAGADDVGQHRFVRELLEHRDVFQGGGVEHDIGANPLESAQCLLGVPHVGKNDVRLALPSQGRIMEQGLVTIESPYPGRLEPENLGDDLTTDRSSGPCDQDSLVLEQLGDLFEICCDPGACEKVLDTYVPDIDRTRPVFHDVLGRRKDP